MIDLKVPFVSLSDLLVDVKCFCGGFRRDDERIGLECYCNLSILRDSVATAG